MPGDPPTSIGTRVRQALAAGRTRKDVVQELVAGGLSAQSAVRFVERALTESQPGARTPATPSATPASTDESGGRGALISGAFWFSLGGTVTGATYLLAAPGQRVTVAYGAVVAGLIAFGRGLKRWSNISQPFPWLAVLFALAVPPIGAAALVGGSALVRHTRQEARRDDEEKRLDAARAVQEEARAVAERKAWDDARAQAHGDRVARARERLQTSTHSMTLCEAALDLGHMGAREAIPDLIAFLSRTTESVGIRNCAAGALVELGEAERALAFYTECARAGTRESRAVAFGGFGEIGPSAAEVALPYLREAMQSPNPDQRFLSVNALAKLGSAAQPLLQEATGDSEPRVRERASQALASMAR